MNSGEMKAATGGEGKMKEKDSTLRAFIHYVHTHIPAHTHFPHFPHFLISGFLVISITPVIMLRWRQSEIESRMEVSEQIKDVRSSLISQSAADMV